MNIMLVGYGNIGKIIYSLAKNDIVKIVNNFKEEPIIENLNIDIIIDFSNRENIKYICEYANKYNCKVLIGTTGLTINDYNLLKELSTRVAVMIDSNYSKGISILKKIIKENIYLLKDYDIELIDVHHKYKKDVPSGTMKSIESIINDNKYNVTSIRAGTIRGEHEVLFFGDDEYISIKHIALSRKIFAFGAIESAKWLLNKEKGLFSYEDYIFDKN